MFKKIIQHLIIVFLLTSSIQTKAFALGYEGERDSSFDSGVPSHCDTGSLGNFNIGVFSDNRDTLWVLSNPACYAFIIGLGASLFAAHMNAGRACRDNPEAGPYQSMTVGNKIPAANIVNPPLIAKLGALSGDCGLRVGQASAATTTCNLPLGAGAAACPFMGFANASATDCCTAYGVTMGIFATALATLGAMFETAKLTYRNARICGYNWYSWQEHDREGQAAVGGGYWKRGAFEHSVSKKLQDAFSNTTSNHYCGNDNRVDNGIDCEKSLRNKHYREFLYGGVEYIDEEGDCEAPANWDSNKRLVRLGYDTDRQRYYMRGPGMASHYACHRYISTGSSEMNADEQEAFDCCVGRSKTTLCIESKSWPHSRRHIAKFCNLGESDCWIDGVGFKVSTSTSQMNVICAETHTLCPFDHLLGGGTERRNEDETANRMHISGKLLNYCQFNKHCVKVPATPYIRINDYESAFISGACMDFVGHSQNTYANTNEILPVGRIKNFSAPLVECMAETMKNVIQNKAGHTICSDPDQQPVGPLEICGDNLPGDYIYKRGDTLPTPSIFQTVKDFLSDAVRVVLALSVAVLGFGILIGAKPIDRRKISVYIIKFACVMYFAVGSGWNDLFMDNVFKISSSISSLVMRLEDESYLPSQLDGCQFPKFNGNSQIGRNSDQYPDPTSDPFYLTNVAYTDGFDYLRPWDVLDCKFVRALGFGPDLTVPNLILTILAGLLTGGLGIVFVFFSFIFAFFYVALIIRGIHIFLVSIIAITMLIFVSPLTITAVMFEKTKSVFTSWLKQLLGFIIQPVILFAYIALFVVIIDYTALGIRPDMHRENPSAINFNGGITFSGSGLDQEKYIRCQGEALNNSLYCIFGFAKFGTYSGLEPIGILLPFIFNFNTEKLDTIIRSGLLMFIFSQFMDKVSTVASDLTGSSEIRSSTPSAAQIAGKAYGVARGVQKRGTRVAKAAVLKAGRLGAKATRAVASSKSMSTNVSSSASAADSASSRPSSPASSGGGGSSAPAGSSSTGGSASLSSRGSSSSSGGRKPDGGSSGSSDSKA